MLLLAGAVCGSGAWWLVGRSRSVPVAQVQPLVARAIWLAPPTPVVSRPAPPPVAPQDDRGAPSSIPDIRIADEATIVANDPASLTVFRFALNPAIVVIDFPTLAQQGRMLNRLAIFVEKAAEPHDRVLDDAALDAAIRGGGDTAETFYYGHDYRGSDIARFFRLAETEQIALTADEIWLRNFARIAGWSETPGDRQDAALISIPRAGADSFVDRKVRAVILHHELSHGEYFTNPTYAAYARKFWTTTMSEAERNSFRAFLARERYDPTIEDLMMNETQAYLMHTRDLRFFSAEVLMMPQQQIDMLQARFLLDMPPGWLRDCTPAPVAVPPGGIVPAKAPRSLRRRPGYGFGAMSSRKAVAATWVPRRRAASIAA